MLPLGSVNAFPVRLDYITGASEFRNFLDADGDEKVETAGHKTNIETIRDRISNQLAILSESIDKQSAQFEI
jgi:hypothetical protein